MRRARAADRIPIAGFETEVGKYQFARLIDAGAIQLVQFDLCKSEASAEARKIAATPRCGISR